METMIETFQFYKLKIQKLFFLVFFKRDFKFFGKNSSLIFPFKIDGARYIEISSKVHISSNSWIAAIVKSDAKPIIKIGKETTIARFAHFVSCNEINIGEYVLIAEKVYITDNLYSFDDISIPLKFQPLKSIGRVVIGDNTWIGENVCIIGVSIGKRCVIGSNSVVLSDIPDYSVAVGSPAKVIKQYNLSTQKWEKVS